MISIDEVDRYQKLLEEWSWSAKQTGKRAKDKTQGTIPVSRQAPQPVSPPPPTPPPIQAGPYQTGAILCLSGRTLAIYKSPVPEKEYHLMLVLFPSGQVKTQGIALEGHQVNELGCLPPAVLERLQREMRWNRDLVVFHCYSYEDIQRIPQHLIPPTPAATPERPVDVPPVSVPEPPAPPQPVAAPFVSQATVSSAAQPVREEPPAPTIQTLRRGQRLQVKFGERAWHAVYWGKDDQGHVVAHRTNRDWALMHLDLDRFNTDLTFDPNVDHGVIGEIESCLTRN